jgi:hypothetical protein
MFFDGFRGSVQRICGGGLLGSSVYKPSGHHLRPPVQPENGDFEQFTALRYDVAELVANLLVHVTP